MPFTVLFHDSMPSTKEKLTEYSPIDVGFEFSESTTLLPTFPAPIIEKTSVLVTVSCFVPQNITQTITLFRLIIHSSTFCRATMLAYFLLSFATAINGIFTQWSSLVLLDPCRCKRRHLVRNPRLFIVLLSLRTISSVIKPRFNSCSSKVGFFIVNASVPALGSGVLCMALAPTREMLRLW